MRPVGQLTYTPEPAPPQTGVFQLRPDDRMIRSMRIEARGGTVDIQSVRLVYRNGEQERYRIRERLRPGQSTGIIRKQNRGPLRAVEVSYIPQGQVTLVLRANAGGGGGGGEPPPVATWNELGCKTVGFLIDRDRVNVNSNGVLPGAAPALHRPRHRDAGHERALRQWPDGLLPGQCGDPLGRTLAAHRPPGRTPAHHRHRVHLPLAGAFHAENQAVR